MQINYNSYRSDQVEHKRPACTNGTTAILDLHQPDRSLDPDAADYFLVVP
ncbi:MAG: hypothetical protein IMW89_14820 [Ktedonobacteraceae bacterium]|nr:hypothetical protein [Ktedonobacteraceae bacterium]